MKSFRWSQDILPPWSTKCTATYYLEPVWHSGVRFADNLCRYVLENECEGFLWACMVYSVSLALYTEYFIIGHWLFIGL